MRLWVASVSGPYFVNQCAYIAELNAVGVQPDIYMGSSGGAVSGALTLSANWQRDKIKQNALLVDSTMFAQSWLPWGLKSLLPSWLVGYWKGSIYASGTGAEQLFTKLFTPDTLSNVEMWIGTLNRTTSQGQFFCNLPQNKALLQPLSSEEVIADALPLTYLNLDPAKVAQVVLASASIPVLVPEKIIDNNIYVDGGTRFSSPLSALQDNIRFVTGDQPLHIDYMSSSDLNSPNKVAARTIYENGSVTVTELVNSLCLADRQVAIELVASYPGQLCFAELPGNQDSIRTVEETRKSSLRSVLEFYPTSTEKLDITNFTGQDIVNNMEKATNTYKLRFWWIESAGSLAVPGRRVLKKPSNLAASAILRT